MAYYYIKAGGTATGDAGRAATKRTGSFASMGVSAYYDSIYDVFAGSVPTTAPASADNCFISDAHNKNYASVVSLGVTSVNLFSVSDTNADTYSRGALETNADFQAMDIITLTGQVIGFWGISIVSGNLLTIITGKSSVYFADCELGSVWGPIRLQAQGGRVYLSQVDIRLDRNFSTLRCGDGCSVYLSSCKLLAALSEPGYLIETTGVTDTFTFVADSCDFALLGAREFFDTAISTTNVNITVSRCKLPSGFVFSVGDTAGLNSAHFYGCDIGDAAHYYEHHNNIGASYEDTAIYRTAGASYDGSNGFSSELISGASASTAIPYGVEVYNGFIDTTDYTTSVTFTVHFAVDGSAVALNDDEFWIEVEHADGADNALGVIATTKAATLSAGIAPTTETALWTGLGGTNIQMSISKTITIGTTAGTIASGLVRVKAYLGKASQTVFVCPQVEIS